MISEYLIAIAVFGALALLAMFYLRRFKTDVRNRTPDSILNEVEVLMAYGKQKNAVELLREAMKKFPDDKRLNEKLNELG